MEREVERFLADLEAERPYAANTLESYRRDLLQYAAYVREQGGSSLQQATKTTVAGYLAYLRRQGRSPSTCARALVSIRAFYEQLVRAGTIGADPARFVEAPKADRKPPRALGEGDVDRLLAAPSGTSPSALRDKAMLELLYATGLRVSELVALRTTDVNVPLAFVRCEAAPGKERIVPVGGSALRALRTYLSDGREALLKEGRQADALFVTQLGDGMTRQAFWKIVKKYAAAAGIEGDLSPQTLRGSFAAHLLANGADIRAVQEMLGHSAPAATQAYADAAKAKALMKEVYDKAHPRAGST
jgi:integrase/recombinase XerD